MSTGYNWRGVLTHFAAISGVLAGFCITFIALVLSGRVGDIEIGAIGFTFGQITVLFLGIASGLFIYGAELFLHAKEFDVFSIPKSYRKQLQDYCKQEEKDWAAFEDEQTNQCRRSERIGRHCYNFAVFAMFIGLIFIIAPYNIAIAVVVGGLGILLELWQMLSKQPIVKGEEKSPKNRVRNVWKKWVICLILSFDLFLVVYLTEIFRLVIEDIKPNPYTLGNILYFLSMLFLVSFILLAMWLLSPFAIERLLESFGFSEE